MPTATFFKDIHLAVVKLKPEKKISRLNGIRTHDLCDTGGIWSHCEFRNIPVHVEGEEYK